MATAASGLSEIAKRYATALFELADEQNGLAKVESDLRQLKEMIASSGDLAKLLLSPLISREDQGRALAAVLERAKFCKLTRHFAAVVARNRRGFVLSEMIDTFFALLSEKRGEINAEIASARGLDKSQVESLKTVLKKAIGREVSLNLKTDPSLIGGLVVQVGSRMVDSSLKTKLQKLQIAMKEVG